MPTSVIVTAVPPVGTPTVVMSLFDVELSVLAPEGHQPDEQGTLTRISNNSWSYASFNEKQSDKHPLPITVRFIPQWNNNLSGTVGDIVVQPVFVSLVTEFNPYLNAAGPAVTPTAATIQQAIQYIIGKYGVGRGYDFVYSVNPANVPPGSSAHTWVYAWRSGQTFIGTPALKNENILASTIDHESEHRYQEWLWQRIHNQNEIESPAYRRELDNKAANGLTDIDDAAQSTYGSVNRLYLEVTEDLYHFFGGT